jgi:uncharacterized membrane protein YjfL (UPF0719 family)
MPQEETMAQLLVSLAQVIVAVILAIVASYLGLVLFNRATRYLDEWGEIARGNTALGVVLGSVLIGIALVLRPVLQAPPALDAGRLYPVYALGTQLIGVVVGLILAVSSILFSVALFDQLTGKIDELAELQKGNMAVAAILAGVVLAVSLLMSGAVEQIMQWFIGVIM